MGSTEEVPQFGHSMKQHFLFDPKYTNLNHGSFGTYPLPVRNAMRGYQKLAEAAPDKFIRYQTPDLLKNSRVAIARMLNVPSDECVFVQNATSGINTVLRNLVYKPNDVIIYFDTIYGGIEKSLASLLETTPNLQVRKVGHGQDFAYSLPCTHAEILNAFSQTISRLIYDGLTPKVAIFDTIVSLPGVRFPFERLTKMCKEYGILSVIDGAHGVGQIPLNLGALDADFFVSNCHKWLYTPRGCAILHVPTRNHPLIRTTYPTSHGFAPLPETLTRHNLTSIRNPLESTSATHPFQRLFTFTATSDCTPYFCVPAALHFRANLCGGEEEIYRYSRDVAQRGANLLAMVLGTQVMDDLDPGEGLKAMGSVEGSGVGRLGEGSSMWSGGLRDCAMANVLLPFSIVGANGMGGQWGSLGLGPGGAGSGGGLSPFGPMRRSPSPSSRNLNVNLRSPAGQGLGLKVGGGGLRPGAGPRSPSLFTPGHGYSKSSPGPLPIPLRSPSMPIPRSHSPVPMWRSEVADRGAEPPNGNGTVTGTMNGTPTYAYAPQRRQHSPNSPFAYPTQRRSSGPLNIVIEADDVPTHVAWMERMLVEEFNTFVAVYEYKSRMWVRISGQVYLELKDFEWLGGVLRNLCERIGWGESLREGAEAGEPEDGELNVEFEVERVGRALGKLNTDFTFSQGGVSAAASPSGATAGAAATPASSGVRRFDVRVGRWVDG